MAVGTLLIAHGSSIAEHAETVRAIADGVAELSGEPCVACFLDHDAPTVTQGVHELSQGGATRVIAVPLLFAKAFHATVDVPNALEAAATTHHVDIALAEPVGNDERLGDVLERRIESSGPHPNATVVVFSSGTSAPASRSRFVDFVERWGQRHQRTAVAAFVAGGEPSVQQAVSSIVLAGNAAIAAPFLLTDGTLLRRGTKDALTAGALAVSDALGVSDELIEIVYQRRQACASI